VSEAGASRREGNARPRPPWLKWALIALAVAAAFGLGLLLRKLRSDGDAASSPPESVAAMVQAKLANRPQEAALDTVEAARSDLSPEAELAMVDVAVDGQNIERTVDAGAPVTATLVLEHDLVTAGRDGSVKVWSREDGALLGETKAAAPLAALAETESDSPYLAALDRHGAVELVDLTDPADPRVLPLGAGLSRGEAPLAVAYSHESTEIVAVGSGGEVLRLDATTGAVLSRSNLSEMRGYLPWKGEAAGPDLVAARFVPEAYEDEEGLLVGTSDGAVVDVDLIRGQGKTVLPAGVAPGRILSLDRAPYSEVELAVGTSGGLVKLEQEDGGEPQVIPGQAVTGVALTEEELWQGGKEGVSVGESDPSGSSVLGFEVSYDGIAAILPGGMVSLLGSAGVGISMDETDYTPVASFGSDGRLYVAEGYDANHIEELRAVRPQPRPPDGGYQEEDVLQTYLPGKDWWPGVDESEALYSEEEEAGLYVNDVASDGELLVAGGQDPNGDAAVMVWDAKTGKPLRHLPLGSGGITTELPSIVSDVMLLPGKHEIAAYSATQELVAIWSTDTWELVDSVPIGAAGGLSLSPDESTIAAVGIDEEGEGYVVPDDRTDLTFIDVDSGQVTDEVPARGVSELAFSPDGSTLALGDANGYLRFRSADGRQPAGPLVSVHGGIEDIAWRPDGALVAVALSEGGIVLVDPESGQVSESLPHEPYSPTVGLSWSDDGSMLAALTPLSEEESEGSAPDPGPAAIWTLGPSALERRMCELAACEPEAASSSSRLGDVSQLSSVDVAFEEEGSLLVADTEGNTARIGWIGEYPNPPVAYDWSDRGFAWSSRGQVGVLMEGEERPRSWPCACNGVAWSDGEIISLDLSGNELVRIDPERGSLKTTPIDGLPSYSPTLLGAVDGTPIAAAFDEEPTRATPSVLFALEPDGTARKLIGDAHGSVYLHWPSGSPHALAFVTYLSGGACYSFANVGVISRGSDGKLGVDFPASPLDKEEPNAVRSLQVAADGSVSAAIGRICNEDGMPEGEEPPAYRYVLEKGQWQPTGEKGYDVQVVGGGPKLIEESEGFGKPGTLFVVSDGERREIASAVERAVARP
jgi:hypothetical protein